MKIPSFVVVLGAILIASGAWLNISASAGYVPDLQTSDLLHQFAIGFSVLAGLIVLANAYGRPRFEQVILSVIVFIFTCYIPKLLASIYASKKLAEFLPDAAFQLKIGGYIILLGAAISLIGVVTEKQSQP